MKQIGVSSGLTTQTVLDIEKQFDTQPFRGTLGISGYSRFSSGINGMVQEKLNMSIIYLTLNNWEKRIGLCNGVIFPGGTDIDRDIYKNKGMEFLLPRRLKDKIRGKKELDIYVPDLDRDKLEMNLIPYCIEKDIPMFGICRGLQIIGATLGMKFIPELNPFHGKGCVHETHFFTKERNKIACQTNSFHHQGILHDSDFIPDGVKVIATAPVSPTARLVKDINIVEAMYGKRWIAVQWHPESDSNPVGISAFFIRVFNNLIDSNCDVESFLF